MALLKHHLSEENHLELLVAVTGKSVAQTRELIAARFPRPDVASSVRKLPERRPMSQPALALSTRAVPSSKTVPHEGETKPPEPETVLHEGETKPPEPGVRREAETEPGAHASCASVMSSRTSAKESRHSRGGVSRSPASRMEPLSAERYKVQLTASAELARKLELARDLMRHSHPGGELGPIVERALDLLIESLMKQRFGKKVSPKRSRNRGTGPDMAQQLDPVSHVATTREAATACPKGGPDT